MPRMQKTAAAKAASGKITATKDIEQAYDEIIGLFNRLPARNQIELFKKMGVGGPYSSGEYYTCQRCGKVKRRRDFYVSTQPDVISCLTNICKDCANDIAMPVVDGKKTLPTKETVDKACYALDKPFIESLWDSSLLEAANTTAGNQKHNVWTAYIKNVQMINYQTLTYKQSDNYTGGMYSLENMEKDALPADQEILEQFEKNKKDTLKLIGYLPFENEKLSDQPFLYAQLIGFLDASEEGNDDMMRTSSIISIVRSFLQLQQVDDQIAKTYLDPENAEKNAAIRKTLFASKKDINSSIIPLAKESCISLNNSKHVKKGENTWTGKIKKVKDLNLREWELNGFDTNTCKGMRQVMDMSHASILRQLHLDDSEYSDMLAQQRDMIYKLTKDSDNYKEIARILLRENIDLRDELEEHGLLKEENLVNLNDLYSPFAVDEDDSRNDLIGLTEEDLKDFEDEDEDDENTTEDIENFVGDQNGV